MLLVLGKKKHIVGKYLQELRKGTKAASMPQVDGTLKKNRCEVLRKLSDEQESLFAQGQKGKVQEVLIEADHGDMYVGYTREYVKAHINNDRPLEIGSIVKVQAVDTLYSSLICKVF